MARGPAATSELLTYATYSRGNPKEYAEYKAAEIALAKLGGLLGATLSKLIKTKTKPI